MKRKLVLCIDRDDDLGKKAKIKGPFIGEKACIKAAESLAIADPTESDANAIFMAVKLYREMKKDGEDVEVAVIAGHASRSYVADRKVAEQLDAIIAKLGVGEAIFVSDGADDEQMLPMIQSRVKISGVHTVIVKQAKELEKSYYVLKEVLRDPHFGRMIFGVPGVILAIYGIVSLFGVRDISVNVIMGLVGIYLILKGFGIEDAIVGGFNSFRSTTSIERASFPLYLGALFVLLLAMWAAADNVAIIDGGIPADTMLNVSQRTIISAAAFLSGFIGLFSISAVLFLAGRIGDMYYKREYYRIRKYARMAVSVAALFIIMDYGTKFALFWAGGVSYGPKFSDLLIAFGGAFMVTVIGFLIITQVYSKRYVSKRIKSGLEIRDMDGKAIGKVVGVDHKNQTFTYKYADEAERKIGSFGKVVVVKDYVVLSA